MRPASRPMRFGATCCSRYAATASSRPLSVASPSPYTPDRVSILSVTKLRPGEVMITRAATISRSRVEPCGSTRGWVMSDSDSLHLDSSRPAALHPDRLFPADPATRAIARRLYGAVRGLPIISPHGHTDPRWFADDAPFSDPATLLITPDHYIFRMLYSQGVPLEELGIAPRDAGAPRPGSGRSDRNGPAIEPFTPPDPRSVWRRFAEHYFLFRGTPTRLWLDWVLV